MPMSDEYKPTPVKLSPQFLECFALYNAWGAGVSDDDADRMMELYDAACDRLMANEVSWQHVGELAAIWRMTWWQDDEKTGDPKNPDIERALWKAIEKLTGIEVRRPTPDCVAVSTGGDNAYA
jgi:hypothetical protein